MYTQQNAATIPATASLFSYILERNSISCCIHFEAQAHEQLLQGLPTPKHILFKSTCPPTLYWNTILGQDTTIIGSFSIIVISTRCDTAILWCCLLFREAQLEFSIHPSLTDSEKKHCIGTIIGGMYQMTTSLKIG